MFSIDSGKNKQFSDLFKFLGELASTFAANPIRRSHQYERQRILTLEMCFERLNVSYSGIDRQEIPTNKKILYRGERRIRNLVLIDESTFIK